MKTTLIILMLTLVQVGSCIAQKKIDQYRTADGLVLNSGDTIEFLEGSLGGQFVHVFTMWGKTPPVKAAFQGPGTKLIIEYFRMKKKEDNTYAISKIPNVKNVWVWTDIESALRSREINLSKYEK